MIIKILFIQRKEHYEGEFGPEALCCVDEYTDYENPYYFIEESKKQLKLVGDQLAGSVVVELDLDAEKIRQWCLGELKMKANNITPSN